MVIFFALDLRRNTLSNLRFPLLIYVCKYPVGKAAFFSSCLQLQRETHL